MMFELLLTKHVVKSIGGELEWSEGLQSLTVPLKTLNQVPNDIDAQPINRFTFTKRDNQVIREVQA